MKATFFSLGDNVKGSSFGSSGGTNEFFLTIYSEEDQSFSNELPKLYETYKSVLQKYGLSEDTLVFSRFYVSDIANQQDILRQSEIFRALKQGALSIIQQCPVYGGNIGLLVYHIKKTSGHLKKEIYTYDGGSRHNGVKLIGDHYELLWIANFFGIGPFDSCQQTTEIFQSFNEILNQNGMALIDNAIRTWVYVRDIDNHYKGMVEARKAFFLKHGLNPETRYIASTGIEGFSKEVNSLVAFDAYAINHLQQAQIVRMQAAGNMPPTIKYGVTFDRGTRVRFGDRSHLHVSGTASIDKNGEIMHIHDVERQTARTLENIKALLSPHGADLDDMAYFIAYVRNMKDRDKVMRVLRKEVNPDIPLLLLVGAVCRPLWLVELEGVGIISDSNAFPHFL